MQMLAVMAQRCGDYAVLKAVTENAREACRTDYANNVEAVIHRDLASLDAILARTAGPVSSADVTNEEKKELATMSAWYGTYKVVQTLAGAAKAARRESVLLEAALERMKGNHLLRAL
ncbi:hypothetical protein AS149_25615 [Burkholderia cenocepacia]|nr:hypothetical protein AS149_25615 [Burkholderia cenocepacia]